MVNTPPTTAATTAKPAPRTGRAPAAPAAEWRPIENDIVADIVGRAVRAGLAPEHANAIEREARAHWGGDRPYIAHRSGADQSARNNAIRREHARGERVEYLERKYQLSRRRIYAILGQPTAD